MEGKNEKQKGETERGVERGIGDLCSVSEDIIFIVI